MAKSTPEVHAAVLAGGKSRRFGSDKCLAHLPGDDSTFLERAVCACRAVADRVVIVSPNRPEYVGKADAVISDSEQDQGPLAGVMAALEDCRAPYLLVVPCDQPMLTGDLLLRLASVRIEADLTVFGGEDGEPQPLPCLLNHSTTLPVVGTRYRAGDRSLRSLLSEPGPLTIFAIELDAFQRTALEDVDSIADLRRLEASLPLGLDSVQ